MNLKELEEELRLTQDNIKSYEQKKKLKPVEKISYKNIKQREALILSKIENLKNSIEKDQKQVFGNKDIYINVELNKIKPNPQQPRRYFDKNTLQELANSIKNHGVLQPIVLVEIAGEYIILAGERRYKASLIANQKTIPAIIKKDQQYQTKEKLSELALIENLLREDMKLVDEAIAISKLNDIKGNYRTTAESINKGKDYIAQLVNIASFDKESLDFIHNNNIENKRLLNKVYKDLPKSKHLEFLEEIIKKDINLKNYEIYKDKYLNNKKESNKKVVCNTDKLICKEDFKELSTIKFKNFNANRLNIELDINNIKIEELDRIKDMILSKISSK
jgi:ParB family chromosome partitioning protein